MDDFLSHVRAVLYRNALWAYRSPFRFTDVVLWPLFTLFMLTLFLTMIGGRSEYVGLVILSVIGWRMLYFVAFETSGIFIEDHWDRSLANFLVSPIDTLEIAVGGALTGVFKALAVVVLCLAIGYAVFGFVISEPLTFLIALFFLMLSGFSLGLILFGLACYYEKRNVFTLSFILPEVIGLLSGPYFSPKEVFPSWLAGIVDTLPTTHAFDIIKSIYGFAEPDYPMLFATTAVWLLLALALNRHLFDLGRKKGKLVKVG
ncbi:MAG: ABC transporter permease [Candidatus Micrarchaeota archaeon]